METRKTIFFLAATTLILNSCIAQKFLPKDIQGIFVQKNDKRTQLQLNNQSFVLWDNFEPSHLAIKPHKCCDTIAYGKWNLNDGFLSLSTPEELATFYLTANVKEEYERNNDSITFIITNPIEKFRKQNQVMSNELYYKIILMTKDGNTINKSLDSNIITFQNIKDVKTIEIEVYPKYNIDIREISSRVVYIFPHTIVNTNANIYKIDIPELSYSYLTYKRLNQDYIKIIDKNTLLWDGNEYIKK